MGFTTLSVARPPFWGHFFKSVTHESHKGIVGISSYLDWRPTWDIIKDFLIRFIDYQSDFSCRHIFDIISYFTKDWKTLLLCHSF